MANIEVSKTHTINTTAMWGQGLIQASKDGFKASVGCEKQELGNNGQVFAVINHPEHGFIAVTVSEFKSSGLPEVVGFPAEQ